MTQRWPNRLPIGSASCWPKRQPRTRPAAAPVPCATGLAGTRRATASSWRFRRRSRTAPLDRRRIRTVLSRAARAAVKRGERPRKKTAITLAEQEAMLSTCDDSLEGVRDRALLCFGFTSGGRRPSEIAAADLRDLRRIGEAGYIYRLEHSKTQQAGIRTTSTPDKPVARSSRHRPAGLAGRSRDHRRGDLPAALETAGRPCLVPGGGG